MSNEILKRDQNFVTVLAGVTNDADQDITMLRVDPITKRLLVGVSGVDLSVTLADVSANSLTTPNSLYTMTSGVPVNFKLSGGSSLLYLDETNGRIGVGTTTPLKLMDIRGIITATGCIGALAGSTPASQGVVFAGTTSGLIAGTGGDIELGNANSASKFLYGVGSTGKAVS